MWTAVIAIVVLLAGPVFAGGFLLGLWSCRRNHPSRRSNPLTGKETVEGVFTVHQERPHVVSTRGMTRVRRSRFVSGNRKGKPY